MPAPFPVFLGPSNAQRSPIADASKTENLFLSSPAAGAPKASPVAYLRPALRLFASATGPIRGCLNHNGRVFVVGGAYLYELNSNGTVTQRGGPMVLNARQASLHANAVHQIFITSGGEGYIFNDATNVFSNITSPTFPTAVPTGDYLGSYFVALSGADGRFQISGIQDGFTWSALEFGLVSDFADKVIHLIRINDNLALFGDQHGQLWWNNGNASFPFAPLQAGLIEHGIAAPDSAVVTDNHLHFLVANPDGQGIVVRLEGVTPRRISTPAVEFSLSQGDLSRAVAGSFQIQGHLFYVLYVPGLQFSWVYDLSENAWYEWGHWRPNLGASIPFLGTSFVSAWGKNFAGDRQSGALYEIVLSDPAATSPHFSDRIVVAA